jgi:hypothetical protein
MSRVRKACVLFALALAAGCTTGDGSHAHGFGGAFTPEATQEEVAEFSNVMEQRHGGSVAVMESFPMQFHVRGLTETGCTQARQEAAGLQYVDSVAACGPETTMPGTATTSAY